MQVEKNQIIRQQEILGVLGFYFGKFDGVWGPKSIEAKKKFEASPTFVPGIPNNGLPFGDRGPYPAMITLDHMSGLLHHPKLNEKPAVNVEKSKDSDAAEDTSFSLPE